MSAPRLVMLGMESRVYGLCLRLCCCIGALSRLHGDQDIGYRKRPLSPCQAWREGLCSVGLWRHLSMLYRPGAGGARIDTDASRVELGGYVSRKLIFFPLPDPTVISGFRSTRNATGKLLQLRVVSSIADHSGSPVMGSSLAHRPNSTLHQWPGWRIDPPFQALRLEGSPGRGWPVWIHFAMRSLG